MFRSLSCWRRHGRGRGRAWAADARWWEWWWRTWLGYYDDTGCFEDELPFCSARLALELALFFCHRPVIVVFVFVVVVVLRV